MNEKRMSDAEIVAELLASYKYGSTGIYHNNWFMVRIDNNIQNELDRRLSEVDEGLGNYGHEEY